MVRGIEANNEPIDYFKTHIKPPSNISNARSLVNIKFVLSFVNIFNAYMKQASKEALSLKFPSASITFKYYIVGAVKTEFTSKVSFEPGSST